METAFEIVRLIHILGAAVGLLVLLVPLIAKKGGRWHRRAGWIFTLGMIVAGITGIVFAITYLAWPLAARPQWAELTPAAFAEKAAELQMSGLFFAQLSLLLLSALWSSLRAVRRKRRPEPRPSRMDRGFPWALGLVAAVGVVVGLLNQGWLLVGFAAISATQARSDYRFATQPLPSKMAWWYQHMNGMMTATLSAVTAFMVLNANRLFGELPPSTSWIPWVAPSIIAVPGFAWWTRYYKVKFGDAKTNSPALATG